MSNPFETEIFKTFPEIRSRLGAFLFTLYPPVQPTGLRGKCPVFTMVGTAMFDVCGWQTNERTGDDGSPKIAQILACELKQNGEYKPSMPIVAKGTHASGLQYHQLEALAAVARDGGLAGLVWDNGGAIGVVGGAALQDAFLTYLTSLETEKAGNTIPRGSRSIPWAAFNPVKGDDVCNWFDTFMECNS